MSSTESTPTKTGARIAKVIARAGLCSRRDAEKLIEAGKVSVDGRIIRSPALDVTDDQTILVDGKPLPDRDRTRLFRLHKQRGLVTTARDPQHRPTVFGALPEGLPRLISVGRLDINSEGLLLLTNDGELARTLELPTTGWVRRYRVRVNGRVDPAALSKLAEGVTVDGVRYAGVRATLDRQQHDNAWLTMSLTEGKNREIRKLCEYFGWQVNRLIRIAYGPFQLGDLKPGAVEEVPGKVLREQLGLAKPGAAKRREERKRPPLKERPARERPAKARSARERPAKERPAKDQPATDRRTKERPAPSDRPSRGASAGRNRSHAHRRRPS